MGQEARIEREVCRRMEDEHGVRNLKLKGAGSTGWPDRIFFIPGGRPVFVEFKAPGEQLRPKQAYVIRIMRELEYTVQVHDDVDEAMRDILSELRRALKRKT
jgi:uncharacterized protein YyaL (SSP411 family)